MQGGLGSLMHLKQAHPHLQVILSVGGGSSGETFPLVASDPLLRDNFARSARGLVEASGLDGLDSEPMADTSLIRSLTERLTLEQFAGNTPQTLSRGPTSSSSSRPLAYTFQGTSIFSRRPYQPGGQSSKTSRSPMRRTTWT